MQKEGVCVPKRLQATSALGSELQFGYRRGAGSVVGVSIRERTDLAMCTVIARTGRETELSKRIEDVFGVTLPTSQQYVATSSIQIAGAGPAQWLVMRPQADGTAFKAQIEKECAGLASAFDQSDGRAVLKVTGERAREALQKGVLFDLHPVTFGAGRAAVTSVAYIGVHFWQTDDRPSYECAVFRSFAEAFCEWMLDAAGEFGAVVNSDFAVPHAV
jgi:sarcosine oxidase subunit gamma